MRILIVVMISLFCFSGVFANGPFFGGFEVEYSRNNNNTIFASADNLYKTTNGGNSWVMVASGEDETIVTAPSNPNIIYATNHKSTDGGNTWINFDGKDIMAVHPTNSNLLLGKDYGYSYSETIYVSINGGETWQSDDPSNVHYIYSVVSSCDSFYLLAYETNPARLDIYISDNGFNWTLASSNLELISDAKNLIVDPSNSQHIAVCGNPQWRDSWTSGQCQVAISSNGGQSWTISSYFLSDTITVYGGMFIPEGSINFYAMTSNGLYKTTNCGSTWTNLTEAPELHVFSIDYFSSTSEVVIACDQINISSNFGGDWINIGINSGDYYSCLGSSQARAFCSEHNMPLMTSDNGSDWFPVYGQSNWFHCNSNATVLAVRKDYEEFCISVDNGNSWIDLLEPTFSFFRLYPASSQVLYGFGGDIDELFCVSTDGGNTWNNRPIPISSSFITDISTKLNDPMSIFILSSAALYFSGDGSISWENIVPDFQYSSGIVTSFCLQQSSNILYAGASVELARSVNDGASWEIIYSNPYGIYIQMIAAHPIDTNILYGIGYQYNNYDPRPIVSNDGGVSWSIAYPDMELMAVPTLCVDLSDPDFVFYTGIDGIIRLDMSEFTDVSEKLVSPDSYELISAYPNPFNASMISDIYNSRLTTIRIP